MVTFSLLCKDSLPYVCVFASLSIWDSLYVKRKDGNFHLNTLANLRLKYQNHTHKLALIFTFT